MPVGEEEAGGDQEAGGEAATAGIGHLEVDTAHRGCGRLAEHRVARPPWARYRPAIDCHAPWEVNMVLQIELEQEANGRWIGEVDPLPGVLAYGTTRSDALARVQALALRVLADRLEHGEAVPEILNVAFHAA